MEIKLCKHCNGLFETEVGANVCSRCLVDNQESFECVREYLRKHPGTPMSTVAEQTGIAHYLIEHFLKQERIEVAPDSPITLACNKCGTRINAGMYCEPCGISLREELGRLKNALLEDIESQTDKRNVMQGRMRYVLASDSRK